MTDLVKDYISQKPVKWSEEDERIRKDIIRVLKSEISFTTEKYIDWLNPLTTHFFLKRIREINKKKNIIKISINNEDYSKQIYSISRLYRNGIL